jgi:hypothetical protein
MREGANVYVKNKVEADARDLEVVKEAERLGYLARKRGTDDSDTDVVNFGESS